MKPLVLLFCLFLYPFSISGAGGGMSANYLFALFPLGAMLLTGNGVKRPSDSIQVAILVYAGILVLALLSFGQEGLFHRRLLSFAAFISVFAFAFVRIDARMIDSFKSAIVIMAGAFSAHAVLGFLWNDIGALGFGAKGAMGGQRYGFVYLLAFWTLLLDAPRPFRKRLVKAALLGVITLGLLLTFSRSSLISLAASLALFGLAMLPRLRVRRVLSKSVLKRAALVSLAAAVFWIGLLQFFPLTLQFFEARLISPYTDRDKIGELMANHEASDGKRLVIWERAAAHTVEHPLTGSGYLGVWSDESLQEITGSAHNQYVDVLYRTGFVGLAVYVLLLWSILRRLRLISPGLYWGFLAVLIYGVFHETFKLSQGAFILSFFVGMANQKSLILRSQRALPIHRKYLPPLKAR